MTTNNSVYAVDANIKGNLNVVGKLTLNNLLVTPVSKFMTATPALDNPYTIDGSKLSINNNVFINNNTDSSKIYCTITNLSYCQGFIISFVAKGGPIQLRLSSNGIFNGSTSVSTFDIAHYGSATITIIDSGNSTLYQAYVLK